MDHTKAFIASIQQFIADDECIIPVLLYLFEEWREIQNAELFVWEPVSSIMMYSLPCAQPMYLFVKRCGCTTGHRDQLHGEHLAMTSSIIHNSVHCSTATLFSRTKDEAIALFPTTDTTINLRQYLERLKANDESISIPFLNTLLYSVLSALHDIWFAGFRHRDLAPRNVIIDDGGNVRVCDFGMMRLGEDDETAASFESDDAFEVGELTELEHETVLYDMYGIKVILLDCLQYVPDRKQYLYQPFLDWLRNYQYQTPSEAIDYFKL